MGTVWLARLTGKLGFERLIALKTILPLFSNDRQFCDMFLDEARIAAQIDHENVARILEIGEDRGLLYYAMELIDGESLRKLYRDVRAAKRVFPLGVALRIVADACAGLHATHDLRGGDDRPLDVVHRDVSPQNLLISIRGTTKLIDFGVAKANARRSEQTAAGTLKGKLEYMAPEQARGEPLDRRADVYALGAVLYELLAGRPVRDTDEGKQLVALHEIMTGAPYEPLPATVPSLVRGIVDRALARDPAARFASADHLRKALEQAMLAIAQPSTTDDVAKVLAHFSRERTAKRKDAIDRAVRAAGEGRLNAETLAAPMSVQALAVAAVSGPSGAGAVAAGSASGGGSGAGSGPRTSASSPSASSRSLSGNEAGHTGPSMRTIGAASLSTRPLARSSAAKASVGLLLLGLVVLMGVVAGVVVSRRGQQARSVASATSAASASTKVGASASAASAASAEPIVVVPSFTPAAPVADDAGVATARPAKDAGATTRPSPARRVVTKPAPKPAAKPVEGDEYGF